MDDKLYNLDSLRKLLSDDNEEVHEMIQMFIEIAPSTLSDMEEAYNEENFEELGKLAHKLKRLMEKLETPLPKVIEQLKANEFQNAERSK